MKCPICKDTTLVMSERKGIEIDYCPECRGVWLDRGELDKLLETANKYEEKYSKYEGYNQRESDYSKYEYDTKKSNYDKDYYKNKNYYPKKKKKESMFSEIFEIFGE